MKNKIVYTVFDGRSKQRRWLKKNGKTLLGVTVLSMFAGCILACYIFNRNNVEIISPVSKPEVKIEVKQVEAVETPYCYDPITCIRDIGEEMGFSNQEIITAIKIAKCESGLRADAVAHEPNKTYSWGVMQINDVHTKRISRQDLLNFEKNIRFAWTLRKEQGHWGAWSCSRKIK